MQKLVQLVSYIKNNNHLPIDVNNFPIDLYLLSSPLVEFLKGTRQPILNRRCFLRSTHYKYSIKGMKNIILTKCLI